LQESQSHTQDRRRPFLAAVGLWLILGMFVLRCLGRFAGAGHDDTFITLHAAESLATGQGFVTPNAEVGEIGSSLLHVLLLASFAAPRIFDMYLVTKILGLLAGSATLILLFVWRSRLFPLESSNNAIALLAAWLTSLLPSFCFWAMGGLETPLVALGLVWLTFELMSEDEANAIRAGGVAFLLATVRPEGVVYLTAVAVVGGFNHRSRRWWTRAVAFPAVGFLALSLVRWSCLGTPVPLPVLAKIGASGISDRVWMGLSYLAQFARASLLGGILLGALVIGSLFVSGCRLWGGAADRGRLVRVPMVLLGVHLAMVVSVGGDWMVHSRFVVPAIPLLAVVLGQTMAAFLEWRRRTLVSVLLVALALAAPAMAKEETGLYFPYFKYICHQRSILDLFDPRFGATVGERMRRLNHAYRRDEFQLRPFLVGPLASRARDSLVTVASCQMGYLPYEVRRLGLKNVRFVDTFGLVDPELARIPGARTALGLAVGNDLARLMDPRSSDPVARAVQDRHPDFVYMLAASPAVIEQMQAWNWRLVWNAPEAKIFARASSGAARAPAL